MSNYPNFEKLIDVVNALRDPDTGCPWDLEQNHQTLTKYLIEESFEFLRAVEMNDTKLMEEEIGDVLLQVLLHSKIASENSYFDIETVSETLCKKLIRRHPHVFKNNTNKKISAEEVTKNWLKIKEQEKSQSEEYYISDKCLDAPSLKSSETIGLKTSTCNFDWENYGQVIYKVEEEWQELKEELGVYGNAFNKERVKEEMGDLLFSMAQLARHLDLDPEQALRDANKKFLNRFHFIEDEVRKSGKNLSEMNQDDLEQLWNQAKKH